MTSQRPSTTLVLGNNTKFQTLKKLSAKTEIFPISGCATLEMTDLTRGSLSQRDNIISNTDLIIRKEKCLKSIEKACHAAQISTRQRHLLLQLLDNKLCVFIYLQSLWHRKNIKGILVDDVHKSIGSEKKYWEHLSKLLATKLFSESQSSLTTLKHFASQILAFISLASFFWGQRKSVCIATGLKYGMHSLIKRNQNFDFLIPSDGLSLKETYYILSNKGGNNIYAIPRLRYGSNELKRRILDLLCETHVRTELSLPALQSLGESIVRTVITDDSFNWFDQLVLKHVKANQMICHQLRWGSAVAYADQIKKNNGNVFLISHGSHGVGKNLSDDVIRATSRFCDGMLFSDFNTHSILQTPNAEKAFNFFNNKNSIISIKAKPVLWGRNLMLRSGDSDHVAGVGELTVLYAGTAKTLNSRPILYESDYDYIKNFRVFFNIAVELSIKIILRHRDSWALPLKLIKKEFSDFHHLLEFSENVPLSHDFRRCSLVVSHSSTIVEEALIARRPVLLFGGDNTFEVVESSGKKEGRSTCPWVTKATTSDLPHKLSDLVDRLARGKVPEGRNIAEWGEMIDDWKLEVCSG